ncbi:NACHT, LRR and PYD domains-containing protein 3-like isoform X2 [Scyliorhinus canicula]|uniref:NACHT, LRR and PYD domains-containing protein 3-like isoform X2 n=1 Tax=Scyliorhinus canicula TaxID=7830 RepID=UPI0018F638B4|nr:NACHT, LRR and PYD domains-containing protein 3-like isoform X2 [Scyliorhinus canicula]
MKRHSLPDAHAQGGRYVTEMELDSVHQRALFQIAIINAEAQSCFLPEPSVFAGRFVREADTLTEMGQLLCKACCNCRSSNEQEHYSLVPGIHVDGVDWTDTGEASQKTGTINNAHSVPGEDDQPTGTGTNEHSQIQAPAPGEGDQTTGTGTNEHSQIQAPGEGDQTTGTGPSKHSQIQAPAPGEDDQTTGTGTSEHSQIQAPGEGDQTTGTGPSKHSQIQAPAPEEDDQTTGTGTSEHSQIQAPAPGEGDQTTGTGTSEHSQIQAPVPGEGDQTTGTGPSEHSQIQAPAPGEGDQTTGTGPSEHSQIQAPAPGEGDQTTGTGPSEHSQIQAPAPGEDDQTTGTGISEHSQIQAPAPGEGDQTTGTGPSEHSQIQAPVPGEGDQTTGTSSGKENLSGDMLLVNAASYDGKTDIERKHKKTLLAQTETLRVNTILIKEKVKIFQLVDRYAELTVISTVRDRTLVEHELLARGRDHDEWRKKHLRRELENIQPDQLFQSSFSQRKSKSGSSAAVSGVSGIGKTTMVQKIVYDWATGKIYPHFQFVFSFKFRDLNTINCRINLRKLILNFYPYFGNVLVELWKNPEGLLFIFDGLDEFKDRIDFADNRRNTEPQSMCTDPECQCEVSDIVYSLIQHKLLPGCSVLVTTRPTALHLLEKAEISVWAEILGFVGDERKEYFNKFFDDQTVAEAVFKHVEENEILYTMCYNPSYCWILGLSLGPFFTQSDRKQQQVPKTITQLYSYYIYNILKNHGREIESPRDVLLKLGEMALTGVSEKKIVFRNGDLIKSNLQPSQFLSGFLMELLERDDSAQSAVYTFPHLTIQEFVAALALFLTSDPRDIGKLLSEAHIEEDGRFEIFLRFVAGLSSPQAARPLEEFLGKFSDQITDGVIGWVKGRVESQIGKTESETAKRKLLNTFHYLFESQNKKVAQATVGSADILLLCGLTLKPVDCTVLSHVIGLCDIIKELNLESCNIHCDGFQQLRSTIHKCQVLRLKNNKLGDSGMKELLFAALRKPDCKIQKLDLWAVDLTDACAEDLASALKTNSSLTSLNLGSNAFTDQSIPDIRRLILNCRNLDVIWLVENQFTLNRRNQLISLQGTRRGLSVKLNI